MGPLMNEQREQKLLIDPRALDEIRSLEQNGVPGLLSKAINKYLEHSQRVISALETAVRDGDADGQYRAAHSLKGSSASMGALGLAELCGELETMGRQNKVENSAQLFGDLLPLYGSVCEVLKTHRLEDAA